MNLKTGSVAFVGGRGAGKSRLSRKFGKLSGRAVMSTDALISYEWQGLSITAIVEKHGWKEFRSREYKMLKKLCKMRNIVIDCGGGILVEAPGGAGSEETFSARKAGLLSDFTCVVYVKRDIRWLMEKSRTDSGRPLLSDGPYESLLRRRLPWFESSADVVLDMTDLEIDDAAEALIQKLGRVQ